MSAPQTRLPGWIDYGIIPLTNLLLALLVAGSLVVLIGESPVEAVQLMLQGSLGFGEGIGFTLFYATSFILTGLPSRSPSTADCSISVARARRTLLVWAWRWWRCRLIPVCTGRW